MADVTEIIELDYLYNASDKLYSRFARSCGLSTCAYWMMYDLEQAGGSAPLTRISCSWAYSKQTISSALKSLEARGLIELEYVEGSRRNKLARLTAEGDAFVARHIRPAMEAEARALATFEPEERETMMALTRKLVRALEAEFEAMREAEDE